MCWHLLFLTCTDEMTTLKFKSNSTRFSSRKPSKSFICLGAQPRLNSFFCDFVNYNENQNNDLKVKKENEKGLKRSIKQTLDLFSSETLQRQF